MLLVQDQHFERCSSWRTTAWVNTHSVYPRNWSDHGEGCEIQGLGSKCRKHDKALGWWRAEAGPGHRLLAQLSPWIAQGLEVEWFTPQSLKSCDSRPGCSRWAALTQLSGKWQVKRTNLQSDNQQSAEWTEVSSVPYQPGENREMWPARRTQRLWRLSCGQWGKGAFPLSVQVEGRPGAYLPNLRKDNLGSEIKRPWKTFHLRR